MLKRKHHQMFQLAIEIDFAQEVGQCSEQVKDLREGFYKIIYAMVTAYLRIFLTAPLLRLSVLLLVPANELYG